LTRHQPSIHIIIIIISCHEIPCNKSPLDFGDQAAHGARNEPAAADPGTGLVNKWMDFYAYYDHAT